jgi:hypothetical protein
MKWLVLGWLLVGLTGVAASAEPSDKLKQALRILDAGRCEALQPIINAGLADGERDLYYVAGFMFSRGMCVSPDTSRALKLLEAAARAGQSDAAMELVLVHGMGRGVPQSYAQAGRWAQAVADMGKLHICDQQSNSAPTGSCGAGPLDADYAAALGHAGTVHALVVNGVRAAEWQLARRIQDNPLVLRVIVSSPDLALHIEGSRNGSPFREISHRFIRDAGPLVEMVKGAYENAIAAVPRSPPCKRDGCTVRVQQTFGFRLE